MGLKNKEARKLAQQLAKVAREGPTEAVRQRLERVRPERGASLSDRLLQIGKDCATHLKEPFRSIDHDRLFYDEKGRPR